MSRLFDAGKPKKRVNLSEQHRIEVAERARQAELLAAELQENEATDKASMQLKEALSGPSAVQAVRYDEYRRVGSKWLIEHARAGDDYVIQLFPVRPPHISQQDVMLLAITALDPIFPPDIIKIVKQPNPEYKVQFYTFTFKDVTKLPGWQTACRDKALLALSEIQAWPPMAKPGR